MVEVFRSNFDTYLPIIEKAVENCTFIAIDTEFTGLDLGGAENARFTLFDTLPERYQKLKIRATQVIPCQIGLSIFTKSQKENSYSVETYTFYVCPQKICSIDKTFTCQASALEFLGSHDFDFNKLFKCGIPFLNMTEEQQALEDLFVKPLSASQLRMMDSETIREIDMKINELLESSTKRSNKDAGTIKSITLPINKACHVYFQLNEIRHKYPSTWAYTKDDMIVVKMVTRDQRMQLKEQIWEEAEKLVEDYVGFSKVFQLLKNAHKPIVGHNCLMDLMLFYQHFHNDLPDSYESFKEEMHDQFHIIYDTRHIWLNLKSFCNFQNLPKKTSLMDIYDAFQSPVDELSTLYQPSITPINCENYLHGKYPHESGYDAYITGCIFIRIGHLLSTKKSENDYNEPFMKFKSFNKHMWAITPFINKVFVAFSKRPYIDFNTNRKDAESKVPGDLYIVPKKNRYLDNTELSMLFDNFTYVEWKLVNRRRAAIVAVGNILSYNEILKRFKDDPDYHVSKYHPVWHSRHFRPALWTTIIASSCLLAVCFSKFL